MVLRWKQYTGARLPGIRTAVAVASVRSDVQSSHASKMRSIAVRRRVSVRIEVVLRLEECRPPRAMDGPLPLNSVDLAAQSRKQSTTSKLDAQTPTPTNE